MIWIPLSALSLPPENEYVLCWLPDAPWRDFDPKEGYRAKVMCRRYYYRSDCRYPGWRWDEFGAGSASPGEVSHWAPLPKVPQ